MHNAAGQWTSSRSAAIRGCKGYAGGRSINLALAERGRNALRQADADDAVMAQAVMMRGRNVHPLEGGRACSATDAMTREVIWSIHRGELNIGLLDLAERPARRLHFDQRLERVDFDSKQRGHGQARWHGTRPSVSRAGRRGRCRLLAAGGDRQAADLGERTNGWTMGYKELEIPPAADGGFRIEPNALHIWPRGHYMCIALPNDERPSPSPCSCRMKGVHPSFDTVRTCGRSEGAVRTGFRRCGAVDPELEEDWERIRSARSRRCTWSVGISKTTRC